MQHNTVRDYDYLFKILIVGDPGSGQTWFLRRIIDELIPDVNQPQPLDVDFKIKTITEPETNKVLRIQLWKHKQERYQSINASLFRGGHGIIVTVDVTSRDSFNNLKEYFKMIDRYACSYVRVLVIATKTDDSTRRCVWTEEILDALEKFKQEEAAFSLDHDVQFMETSAKDDINVTNAFQAIIRSILMRILKNEKDHPLPKHLRGPNNKSEKPRCIVM